MGKKPYLWRLEAKPSQDVECVFALGCSGNYFSVGAFNYGSDVTIPARGAAVTPSQK